MCQSLSSIYLHAVFSTKGRLPLLVDPGLRRDLHAYVAAVSTKLDCPAIQVGGWHDHVHLLVRLGKQITVADWMREVKRVSSALMKERDQRFNWQSGYGLFSIHAKEIPSVTGYIRNQEAHHRQVSFQDELRSLMAEHGVEWDEDFIWRD
jgi:putative transposase